MIGREPEASAPDAGHRGGPRLANALLETVVVGAIPFLAVICVFAFYGQQHRKQSGDTYGTVMTAVAMVQERTIWLDRYLPYIRERSGERPYMVTEARNGHSVNLTPFAPSLLAVPTVIAFDLAGTDASDWDRWMEAGMLTAGIAATLSVLVLFTLCTRLTTRRRALLIACVYAFGTLTWGVAGQALWQHAPAMLALSLSLLALHDRRLALAGASLAAMVVCRPSTPILAVLLLPLVGRSFRNWARFAFGALPVVIGLVAYNLYVFGSPARTGYTSDAGSTASLFEGRIWEGLPGLLISPGRGLLVYSPVLVFAVVGAVKGFGTPLFCWSALAALAYVCAMGGYVYWWGGESFGPRLLSDVIPLLALLLLPALDVVSKRSSLRIAFGATLAWSAAVQALGASAWPPAAWYDVRDLSDRSIWWSPTSNELVAMLEAPDVLARLGRMSLVLTAGLALAFLAARVFRQHSAR